MPVPRGIESDGTSAEYDGADSFLLSVGFAILIFLMLGAGAVCSGISTEVVGRASLEEAP